MRSPVHLNVMDGTILCSWRRDDDKSAEIFGSEPSAILPGIVLAVKVICYFSRDISRLALQILEYISRDISRMAQNRLTARGHKRPLECQTFLHKAS